MHIVQRRFTTATSFEFEPDVLKYVRSDIHGAHSFAIQYGSIDMDVRYIEERNGALFNGGLLLLAWGVAQTLHAMSQGGLLGLLFLLPGPFCLGLHALAKTAITSLGSDAGEIAVLHDKHHDTIMSEIRERRKKQLLDWYGTIDFNNDPEEEIEKFHWLHEQHLITADQLQRIVNTIRDADAQELDAYEERPLPHQ